MESEARYILFKECGRTADAVKLRNLLVEHGIDVEIRSNIGWAELPRIWTQVWVANDQVEKAVKIAEQQ